MGTPVGVDSVPAATPTPTQQLPRYDSFQGLFSLPLTHMTTAVTLPTLDPPGPWLPTVGSSRQLPHLAAFLLRASATVAQATNYAAARREIMEQALAAFDAETLVFSARPLDAGQPVTLLVSQGQFACAEGVPVGRMTLPCGGTRLQASPTHYQGLATDLELYLRPAAGICDALQMSADTLAMQLALLSNLDRLAAANGVLRDSIDALKKSVERDKLLKRASGVIAAARKVSLKEAMDILRNESQRFRQPMETIAAAVVRSSYRDGNCIA